MNKKEKKKYYRRVRLQNRLERKIPEAIETLQNRFIKKPNVDSIVMDFSAERMARRGIELRL